MTVRHGLVLAHRYIGLAIALFLIAAASTGVVIAFQDELDRALNPELFDVRERQLPPLSANELASRVARSHPHAFITQLFQDRRPGESVRIRLAPLSDPVTQRTYVLTQTEIFVDPFDGRILGGRERGIFHADRAHLMPFLDKFHYTLALPEVWGRWVLGLAALVWTFDCFIGFYITLPPASASEKTWRRRWAPAWRIKPGASFTRLNFDWHRASGLWLWALLLLLAVTSVYFNLTHQVFRPVLSLFGPLSTPVAEVIVASPHATSSPALSFEQAIDRAREALSASSRDMIVSYVGLTTEAPGVYKVRFTDADRGYRSWKFHVEEIHVDGTSGTIVATAGHHVGTHADKVIFWQYPLHSGKVFGFWGRAFMAAIALLVVLLSTSGVVIWAKKRLGHASIRARVSRHNDPIVRLRGGVPGVVRAKQ